MPTGITAHNPAQLLMTDNITELDLLLPDPTIELEDLNLGESLTIDRQSIKNVARNKITLDNDDYVSTQTGRNRELDSELMMDAPLDLDIGDDLIGGSRMDDLSALEFGRDAPADRTLQADLFSDMELDQPSRPRQKDLLEEDDLGLNFDEPLDLDLGLSGDHLDFNHDTTIQPLIGEDTEIHHTPAPEREASPTPVPGLPEATPVPEDHHPRSRSASPLSSVRSSVERDLTARLNDATFVEESTRLPSEDLEDAHHPAHNAVSRKRKVVIDPITEMKAKQIKAQLADRSKILKEPSFLNRDPTALALMKLTVGGGLALSVFRPRGIAPELGDLLSPEFVKRMAELKRKRTTGEEQAQQEDEERPSPSKQARIEIDALDESTLHQPMDLGLDDTAHHDQTVEMLEIPDMNNDFSLPNLGDESTLMQEFSAPEQHDQPEKTTAGLYPHPPPSPSLDPPLFPPMLTNPPGSPHQEDEQEHDLLADDEYAPQEPEYTHPQTQTISRETRNAVHVLREQFDSGTSSQSKSAVVFQNLLPPATTTRTDATKMFFEVLVLATKDAVKVSQNQKVGKGFGDIHIGPKKALWGSWAEERDEQQKAEEEEMRERGEKGGRVGGRREVVVGRGVEEAGRVAIAGAA